jgi:hypothetical protein
MTTDTCEAAGLLGDVEPCEGDARAVKVFESSRPIREQAQAPGGTLACVRHGARLYARIDPSRALVYPVGGPNRPDQPAITVYKRAARIRDGHQGDEAAPVLHWPAPGLRTTTLCQGEPLTAADFAPAAPEVTCSDCRTRLGPATSGPCLACGCSLEIHGAAGCRHCHCQRPGTLHSAAGR